jgi:probable rRNA maturation factor
MKIVHFTAEDVVRHPLVGRIVSAYERETAESTQAPMPTPVTPEPAMTEVSASFDVDVQIEAEGWHQVFGPDSEAEIGKIVHAASHHFEPAGDSFALLLTSDAIVQGLNAQWRNKDQPTNVLSFPAPETVHALEKTLGDVALAYETCAREAEEQGKNLKDHATHLLVHGLLHLLGYDHEAEDDAAEMEGLEREILASLGIADPYQTHD